MAGRLAAALALSAVAGLLVGWAPRVAGVVEYPKYPCFGRVVTVVATNGDDVIRGTPGDDVINALKGDDRIWGRGGNDRLCGGRGDDRVYGNPGRDRVKGGPGEDHARGGKDTDFVLVLDFRPGNDVADGGLGVHDGCSVDAAFRNRAGDEYTDECEDVVGGGAIVIGRG
jgi:Ca2+-binding RTX toxin-like protein